MADRNARDFAPAELALALTEVTACLEVYRTYIRDEELSEADRGIIRRAAACARDRSSASLDPRLFAFLERVLLVDPPHYAAAQRDQWLAFVMRWQQFTGRVMAKGVEDTAFYNYNRLLTLNDVGGDPGREPGRRRARGVPPAQRADRARLARHAERDFDARHEAEPGRAGADLGAVGDSGAVGGGVRRWSKMNGPLRRNGVPIRTSSCWSIRTC